VVNLSVANSPVSANVTDPYDALPKISGNKSSNEAGRNDDKVPML
jgi:hypothetical protein